MQVPLAFIALIKAEFTAGGLSWITLDSKYTGYLVYMQRLFQYGVGHAGNPTVLCTLDQSRRSLLTKCVEWTRHIYISRVWHCLILRVESFTAGSIQRLRESAVCCSLMEVDKLNRHTVHGNNPAAEW